ncbi:MAG: hypothetical protein ACK514_15710 [Bacteroidota bacterium]|jgi:hypothetical protein|nr:hypothetical protein [Cytophagales bacterium]MCE2996967.1 hypothetical protein [Flammeovirgaceae bacterium]MCZ8070742.1 hypothetical protein [Cytophagales bacterium]
MANPEQAILTILQTRSKTSNIVNVMDALNYSSENFQKAFDIALEMENRNLVKLLYSNFQAGKVVVEFTLLAEPYLGSH